MRIYKFCARTLYNHRKGKQRRATSCSNQYQLLLLFYFTLYCFLSRNINRQKCWMQIEMARFCTCRYVCTSKHFIFTYVDVMWKTSFSIQYNNIQCLGQISNWMHLGRMRDKNTSFMQQHRCILFLRFSLLFGGLSINNLMFFFFFFIVFNFNEYVTACGHTTVCALVLLRNERSFMPFKKL